MNQVALAHRQRVTPGNWTAVVLGLIVFAIALVLAGRVNPAAAGLLYAIVFLITALTRPEVSLMMIFAAAPYPWNVFPGGVNVALAELGILLAFLVTIAQRSAHLRFGPMLTPVLIYLGICTASMVITWRGSAAATSLVQMFIYMICAVTVFCSLVDRKEQVIPAMYALVGSAIFLAVNQILAPTQGVFGLHKNNVGASLSIAFVVAVELWFGAQSKRVRRWMMVALLVIGVGLLVTVSRGAWAGAFVAVCILVGMRQQWRKLGQLMLVGLPVVMVCWSLLPESQQEYAFELNAESGSLGARVQNAEYALSAFRQNPLLGIGLGFRKEHDATNIVLSTLAETGVVGLAAFLAMHVVFLSMILRVRRQVPVTDPMFMLLALGAALLLSRFVHGLVDHYWSRGALAIAWSGAGMATLAFLTVRARQRVQLVAAGRRR